MFDCGEAQVERFAPGFRDCIVTRSLSPPAALERWNRNLIGGDLSGGAMNLRQLLFRPTASLYRTAVNVLCLCGASTPPGGGVYDMSGFHSAQAGMRYLRHSSWVRSLRRGGIGMMIASSWGLTRRIVSSGVEQPLLTCSSNPVLRELRCNVSIIDLRTKPLGLYFGAFRYAGATPTLDLGSCPRFARLGPSNSSRIWDHQRNEPPKRIAVQPRRPPRGTRAPPPSCASRWQAPP